MTVTERLVAMVSDQLREYLVAHHDLPAGRATEIILQTRDRVTLNLSHGSDAAELVALTEQMHCQGRLTSLLVCGRSAWVRWRFSRQRWRHSPACRSRTHVS